MHTSKQSMVQEGLPATPQEVRRNNILESYTQLCNISTNVKEYEDGRGFCAVYKHSLYTPSDFVC